MSADELHLDHAPELPSGVTWANGGEIVPRARTADDIAAEEGRRARAQRRERHLTDEPEERAAIIAESAPDGGDPIVSVLYSASVRSWPRFEQGGVARSTRLGAALSSRYAFDAHAVQYAATPIGRRLSWGALDRLDVLGGPVRMVAILFDVDAPGHGADIDVEAWWKSERAKVEPLGTFAYRTRGGYRLAFFLPAAYVIETRADAEGWSAFYLSSVAYLRRAHDIAADPVADWQRLFRLPHATRDAGGRPEEHETIGEAAGLAPWLPRITAEDVDVGARLRRKAAAQRTEVRASTYSGDGLLFALFYITGRMGPCLDAGEGKYAVLCPRDDEHSKRGIDTSTVLWTPGPGEEVGWLHCSHTSKGHNAWTVRDVLSHFSEWEQEQARRMADLPPQPPRARGERRAA
jgi:hypothetical protein